MIRAISNKEHNKHIENLLRWLEKRLKNEDINLYNVLIMFKYMIEDLEVKNK